MEEKDIERLLEKFDASSLQEFEMTQGDLHLAFSKRAQAATVVQESVPVVSDAAPAPAAPASTSTSTSAQPAAVPAPQPDAGTPVPAPLVGVAYFAAAPDKPPFKQIGDHVDKGETIFVIEAMKMINEVPSPVSGTLVKRLIDDGTMVEYDEPVVTIKEDAAE